MNWVWFQNTIIPLDKKIKVVKYQLKEDKDLFEQTLDNLKNQFGERSEPETSGKADTLYGDLTNSEGFKKTLGFKVEELEKSAQALFEGKKKEEEINFVIEKAFGKKKEALIGKGGIQEAEAKSLKGDFMFKIESIFSNRGCKS